MLTATTFTASPKKAAQRAIALLKPAGIRQTTIGFTAYPISTLRTVSAALAA
jgi:hypothetical protein